MYSMEKNRIVFGDGLKLIKEIPSNSIHLILSDIPYGINFADWDVLHNNTNNALGGTSPAQKSTGSAFKRRGKPINGWSGADRKIPLEYQQWVASWANDWHRVLVDGASCFVFAGRRFAHRVVVAFEDAGFSFRDMLAWNKVNATFKAQRLSKVYERRNDFANADKFADWRVGNLRPVFEPILWFVKPYKQGGTIADNMLQNGVGAYNLEAWNKYVEHGDNLIIAPNEHSDRGFHPTQKPIKLLKALIELTTQKEQVILDPFAGSGSTLVAAKELGREYIGFEINEEYYNNAIERLNKIY